MSKVVALSDAAILYGAQRYFDGLHHELDWPYRGKFREEEDKSLFLELLHNICLYDQIELDKRPIESPEFPSYIELERFLKQVNAALGREFIVFKRRKTRGLAAETPLAVQRAICKLIASYVHNGTTSQIESVKVPWAYHEPLHHDRETILHGLRAVGVSARWLPFTLFVWRGVWYSAVARWEAKRSGASVAYVAAPGRIAALDAVLNARSIAQFKFPREAVRALSWSLPECPDVGYDFSHLDFVSPFEASGLAGRISAMAPVDALAYVVRYRSSRGAELARVDWSDILRNGASACAVGATIIQIMNNVAGGSVSQIVRLKGEPSKYYDCDELGHSLSL